MDLYAANRADGFDPHADIVAMPFSSGTTGPPKGVCLSHFNLVANCVQIGAKDVMPSCLLDWVKDQEQETILAVLPFFHIYSMELIMLLNMRLGNKIVTLPHLVPPLVQFLAATPVVKAQHLSSVKVVTGGAAPFGPALIEMFMKKVEPNVIEFREGFGMTESSPCTQLQPGKDAVLGGCGNCVPNTIAKLVDIETGALVGPGEQGELCVSGPQGCLAISRTRLQP